MKKNIIIAILSSIIFTFILLECSFEYAEKTKIKQDFA